MEVTTGFWVQMLVYALSFGTFYGATMQRLKAIEKKMDQHNSVMERTFKLEASCKSAHHRIDELRTIRPAYSAGKWQKAAENK